jgi:UDP-N-acetylglucosamine--N-acetylmuramyl-(pentapeptide) pyrophosphoryl-undecaprenol N-acetylglucosamine transferase
VSFSATCEGLGLGRSVAARPCLETGTPIRDIGSIDRLAARESYGLAGGDRLVIVFGGSQAVRRLNDAVAAALPEAVRRVHLVHVTGDAGYAAALAGREALPPELRSRYRPAPFLGEDLLTALAAADVLVGRAGSSTLAEATALGLPMVVVPYPHAGGHQRVNAAVLADAGAARLVDDEAFDAAALLDAIAIAEQPAIHLGMSAAARALARPGAATAIAELLFALASRRSLPDQREITRIAVGSAG